MFKRFSTPFLAFLQTTGLVVYIILVSSFFMFVTPNLNETYSEFFAPVAMLLLFIISAIISATLALGRAGVLFWEKQYKQSFLLILWTVLWGIFYFALFLLVLFV